MNKCELCKNVARMFCDSDQASLCWDCDSRVHTANFLVAKHVRTLLCHACQSPTPWTGSGPKLSPTVSVCEACVNGRNINRDRNPATEDEDSEDDHDDDDDSNHAPEEDDDDSENQVVPLSLPQSLASTSSGHFRRGGVSGSFNDRTAVQSGRYSYNGIDRGPSEERNGTQPWRWRR